MHRLQDTGQQPAKPTQPVVKEEDAISVAKATDAEKSKQIPDSRSEFLQLLQESFPDTQPQEGYRLRCACRLGTMHSGGPLSAFVHVTSKMSLLVSSPDEQTCFSSNLSRGNLQAKAGVRPVLTVKEELEDRYTAGKSRTAPQWNSA